LFSPVESVVRKLFENDISPWIYKKPRVQTNWNAALQTLEGHLSVVYSVVFSPDGKQVVSGSHDETARFWDVAVGAALQTLEASSNVVRSIAFSPDGKQVVSGSHDKTVRLWDAGTGAAIQKLTGHSTAVSSVAFSPGGKQVVSRSYNKTVRLWDTATGVKLQMLEGHSSAVSSVAFSLDSNVEQGLFVSNDWVVEGRKKFLWLPPEYRASCQAVWNNVIVLGHSSGKLSILGFKGVLMLIKSVAFF
jgi:WD40 repeat protein